MFKIILASFQIEDTLSRARFFYETFLLVELSVKVVLKILFLTLNNIDIQFPKKKPILRSYTTAKTLPTIKQIEIIDKKEFIKTVLDENVEVFLVYMISLSLTLLPIHAA